MRRFALVALLFAGVDISFAQDDSYGYAGLGIGVFDYSVKLHNEGFPFAISDAADATRLYGGWRVNENMAIEGSYGQTGALNWSDSISVRDSGGRFGPGPRATIDAVARLDWTIAAVSILGHFNWLFVGIGWYDADGSFTFDTDCSCDLGILGTETDVAQSGFLLRLGAEWGFERWAIRGQYELHDTEGTVSIDAISLGASFKF